MAQDRHNTMAKGGKEFDESHAHAMDASPCFQNVKNGSHAHYPNAASRPTGGGEPIVGARRSHSFPTSATGTANKLVHSARTALKRVDIDIPSQVTAESLDATRTRYGGLAPSYVHAADTIETAEIDLSLSDKRRMLEENRKRSSGLARLDQHGSKLPRERLPPKKRSPRKTEVQLKAFNSSDSLQQHSLTDHSDERKPSPLPTNGKQMQPTNKSGYLVQSAQLDQERKHANARVLHHGESRTTASQVAQISHALASRLPGPIYKPAFVSDSKPPGQSLSPGSNKEADSANSPLSYLAAAAQARQQIIRQEELHQDPHSQVHQDPHSQQDQGDDEIDQALTQLVLSLQRLEPVARARLIISAPVGSLSSGAVDLVLQALVRLESKGGINDR